MEELEIGYNVVEPTKILSTCKWVGLPIYQNGGKVLALNGNEGSQGGLVKNLQAAMNDRDTLVISNPDVIKGLRYGGSPTRSEKFNGVADRTTIKDHLVFTENLELEAGLSTFECTAHYVFKGGFDSSSEISEVGLAVENPRLTMPKPTLTPEMISDYFFAKRREELFSSSKLVNIGGGITGGLLVYILGCVAGEVFDVPSIVDFVPQEYAEKATELLNSFAVTAPITLPIVGTMVGACRSVLIRGNRDSSSRVYNEHMQTYTGQEALDGLVANAHLFGYTPKPSIADAPSLNIERDPFGGDNVVRPTRDSAGATGNN